jgi:hypothetical protein
MPTSHPRSLRQKSNNTQFGLLETGTRNGRSRHNLHFLPVTLVWPRSARLAPTAWRKLNPPPRLVRARNVQSFKKKNNSPSPISISEAPDLLHNLCKGDKQTESKRRKKRKRKKEKKKKTSQLPTQTDQPPVRKGRSAQWNGFECPPHRRCSGTARRILSNNIYRFGMPSNRTGHPLEQGTKNQILNQEVLTPGKEYRSLT